ncbi:hypothetical protein FRB90_003824 [Tulasnella sp. 427]|nr:hypothetical protein FRB90_003824 [Tulasnella sp. 427]
MSLKSVPAGYIREEILVIPKKQGDGDGYVPVLYRPDSRSVIPSAVRYLPLNSRSSSEKSRQIYQRNLALVKERIDAVGTLDPKRILKCYAYRWGDPPFMIVARTGKDPLSRLVERGHLSFLERLKLVYEAGKAIQYLHSRSPPLVHGAVHPKNIFVDKFQQVVLSDWGLAGVWRLMEKDPSFHVSTNQESQVELDELARLGYTAPEYMAEENGEMTPSADIFAYASVILAVLSSRHPHAGVRMWSPKGLAAAQGAPPDPIDHPDLPSDDSLWPLLKRMWARRPEERPTIDEVLKKLEKEVEARTGTALTESSSSPDAKGKNILAGIPDVSEFDGNIYDGDMPGELVHDPDRAPIHGLHADVRRAYWHVSGEVKTVAVKYVRSKGDVDRVNRRLKREAKIWMRFQSPFILKLYGFVPGKEPHLVSPWCQNGTLLEYLAHHLPSESRILELLVHVASGVDYLHSLSPAIIHGDLKPSNVVISDEGRAQLCDFGISKLEEGSTGYTSTNGVAGGTAGYRAPEIKKPGQQSMEADIYALANLIIHSLTGNPPRVLSDKSQERQLPQLSEHPALMTGDRLWPLLMDCLDVDYTKRPRIGKVLDELEAERLLREAAEAEFQLHLTGPHARGGLTLDVGPANQIPRQNIKKLREVAQGYFGDVFEGTMRTVDGAVVPVAIKSLRQVDMQSCPTDEAMHERINKILGAARGVAYLHGLDPPICHADIKPGNVLISDDGRNALLCDFGLALALTILRSPDTTSGDPQGTRGFQAPELIFYSRRTLAGDVYSFACLILDVLSGNFPHWEIPQYKAVIALRNEQMPDPAMHPDLPESDPLWGLLRRCWRTDQAARPEMSVIVKELERRLDAENQELARSMKAMAINGVEGLQTK